MGGTPVDVEVSKIDHRGHGAHRVEDGALTGVIVDAGLKVHRALGPGLMESTYEHCLVYELDRRGLAAQRQVALPVIYEEIRLDAGYRIDVVVNKLVVIEIKAVDSLTRLHEAQLMTYLKLSGMRVGLLMNFNVPLFKDGLKRIIL